MVEEKVKIFSAVMEKHWYALYTRSRSEKKALVDLQTAGIECYLPLYKTVRKWSDRTKKVELVALPSYIFVKLEPEKQDSVFVSDFLVSYVRFEGKAAIIPEKQIVALKRIIESDTQFDVEHLRLKPGDKVKVGYGPLKGVEGEFLKIAGNKRFVIRIDQIGFVLSVHIPFEYLVVE